MSTPPRNVKRLDTPSMARKGPTVVHSVGEMRDLKDADCIQHVLTTPNSFHMLFGGNGSLPANKPTLNQHFFTTRNQGKRSRCFPHCPTETRVPCSCRRSLKSPTGMGKGQRKEMCAVAHKLPGFGENGKQARNPKKNHFPHQTRLVGRTKDFIP